MQKKKKKSPMLVSHLTNSLNIPLVIIFFIPRKSFVYILQVNIVRIYSLTIYNTLISSIYDNSNIGKFK